MDNNRVQCIICKKIVSKKSIKKHERTHNKQKYVYPNNDEINELRNQNSLMQAEISQLQSSMSKIWEISNLYKYNQDYDMTAYIEKTQLKESTKKEYKSIAQKYQSFCVKNKYPIFEQKSLSFYFSCEAIKDKALSSLKKETSQLVSILKNWNPSILPLRIKNVHSKPRFPIGDNELKRFVDETKDFELGIMGKLLYDNCLRINSLISLKVKNVSHDLISVFDSKTSSWLSFRCKDAHFQKLLENKSGDDYVFKNSVIGERDKKITEEMNKEMKKIFVEAPDDMIIASHCFRKGAANKFFDELMKEVKQKLAGLLNHSSTANIPFYVDRKKMTKSSLFN